LSEYFNNIIVGVKSFITGMGLTFKHFKEKKNLVATLQYPHEKWPKPERDIGFDPSTYNTIRSRLHVDIDDCIGCLQCERACPVDCIKIDTIKPSKGNDFDCGITSNDTKKKMIVPRFTIDMSECMYCDLCVHPCPEECIYMVGGPNQDKHEIDYEFSQYERHGLVFEFATATDQDIIDIGAESYLEERKAKEQKRINGANLEGLTKDEVKAASAPVASPPPAAAVPAAATPVAAAPVSAAPIDFNIKSIDFIKDKAVRGVAKKAFMGAKRAKLEGAGMIDFIISELEKASKLDDETKNTLEGFKGSPPAAAVPAAATPVAAAPVSAAPIDFNIKSIDFIKDKAVRGVAKKAFMGAKRAKLEGAGMIDFIISELEKASKLDDETKNTLEGFKGGGS